MKLEFKDFFEFINDMVDPLINPPPKVLTEEEKQAEEDNKKGKEKKSQDTLNPNLPRSGIESLILFLDSSLLPFPFESLDAFKKIPAISRDFSLEMIYQKYRTNEYNAEENTSLGVAKDRMQYYTYEFKESDYLPESS